MGYTLRVALLLSISISAFSAVITSRDGSLETIKVRVDNWKWIEIEDDGDTFMQPKLIGVDGFEGLYFEEGMPEVPVVRFIIKTQNASDIVVKAIEGAQERAAETLKFPLRPRTLSAEKLPGAVSTRSEMIDFSNLERVGPEEMYSIEELSPIKGVKRFLVTLFPLQLNPFGDSASLVPDFNISINYTEADKTGMAIRKPAFAFIVGEKFQGNQSLEDYKTLKESQGFHVETIEISKNLYTPDHIRDSLKNLLSSETVDLQYALIIGDLEDVDSKRSNIIRGRTDHYYRAIDTDDYEDDINGPDIGVGRLTVNSEAELDVVMAKLTRYQENDFVDLDWTADVSFIATDDYTFHKLAEGSHDHVIDNYTSGLGYTGIFPSANNRGGDQLYAIEHKAKSSHLETSFAEGRTIINYSGHGLPTGWHGPQFTQNQVRNLSQDSLPFVISNSCYTGKFTEDEAFAETWIKEAHGAIMFWGSMDVTYWDEDDILEKSMYEGIFKKDRRTFAEITQHALQGVWTFYGGKARSKYYWETYTTFGDPSIQLKSKI
jgi:hypothetical protein